MPTVGPVRSSQHWNAVARSPAFLKLTSAAFSDVTALVNSRGKLLQSKHKSERYRKDERESKERVEFALSPPIQKPSF